MPSSFFRFLASDGEMTWSWSSRRLRVEDLCSNLCWLLACSRMSFPEPVTRTRLAVPLWVFCFGMSSSSFVLTGPRGSVLLPHGAGPSWVVRSCWCATGGSGGRRRAVGGRLLGSRLPAAALLGVRLRIPVRGDHHDHVPAV